MISWDKSTLLGLLAGHNGDGTAGGGVKVSPIAFLIVKDGNVRMLPVASAPNTTSERIVEMIPDLLDKVSDLLDKKAGEGKAE